MNEEKTKFEQLTADAEKVAVIINNKKIIKIVKAVRWVGGLFKKKAPQQ
jgi:hypothetical protein